MNISIIGTGIYSIALALNISNDYQITMWSENKDLVNQYPKTHSLNPLTDVSLPSNIKLTNNIQDSIKDADLIIIGTSAKYVKEICNNIKDYYQPSIPICIASKGIENDNPVFLSDIIQSILKTKHIAVISGPTFAIDLINKAPCTLCVSSTSKKASKLIDIALSNNNLNLKFNQDIYGTQICGSIKNVIAIASGMLDGLGYNESTRAFFLTEALSSIQDLLIKLKCNPNTILTAAGVGDLILTANSSKSRNYKYGFLIGKKASKEELNEYLNNNTTEGYYTLISFQNLLKIRNIKSPLINTIYNIIINNENPQILIDFLINKK